jgi:hypothetical protein
MNFIFKVAINSPTAGELRQILSKKPVDTLRRMRIMVQSHPGPHGTFDRRFVVHVADRPYHKITDRKVSKVFKGLGTHNSTCVATGSAGWLH